MRINAWCSLCALFVAAQLIVVGGQPLLAWGVLFVMLAIASVTLLAWIAIDGRHPTLVVGGAMLLCLVATRGGQPADFLAGAVAAALTGGVLLFKTRGRVCAESSPR